MTEAESKRQLAARLAISRRYGNEKAEKRAQKIARRLAVANGTLPAEEYRRLFSQVGHALNPPNELNAEIDRALHRRTPHFRWKWVKLTRYFIFCIGGKEIAGWPRSVEMNADFLGTLKECQSVTAINRHMTAHDLIHKGVMEPGRLTPGQVRRLALILRDAMLKAEEGPRHRTVFKQRVKLEMWLSETAPKKKDRTRPVESSMSGWQNKYEPYDKGIKAFDDIVRHLG